MNPIHGRFSLDKNFDTKTFKLSVLLFVDRPTGRKGWTFRVDIPYDSLVGLEDEIEFAFAPKEKV